MQKNHYYGCGVQHSHSLEKSMISLPLTKADGVIQQRTDQDRTGLFYSLLSHENCTTYPL